MHLSTAFYAPCTILTKYNFFLDFQGYSSTAFVMEWHCLGFLSLVAVVGKIQLHAASNAAFPTVSSEVLLVFSLGGQIYQFGQQCSFYCRDCFQMSLLSLSSPSIRVPPPGFS